VADEGLGQRGCKVISKEDLQALLAALVKLGDSIEWYRMMRSFQGENEGNEELEADGNLLKDAGKTLKEVAEAVLQKVREASQ